MREFSTSSMVIGALKVARVLRRPFALHDRDHRQLLVRQAIGPLAAQQRDREQSRRPQVVLQLFRRMNRFC